MADGNEPDNALQRFVQYNIRIRKFEFTGDKLIDGPGFRDWFREFSLICEQQGIRTEEDVLRSLKAYGGLQIADLIEHGPDLEEPPEDESPLERALRRIRAEAGEEVNEHYHIQEFYATKPGNKSVTEYYIELSKKARYCGFGDQKDRSILHQLLLHSQDSKLKEEAMEKEWDLQTFLKKANAKATVRRQRVAMEDNNQASVSRVYRGHKGDRGHRGQGAESNLRQDGRCSWCGLEESHPKEQCPAQGERCYNCQKLNHRAAVCRSRPESSGGRGHPNRGRGYPRGHHQRDHRGSYRGHEFAHNKQVYTDYTDCTDEEEYEDEEDNSFSYNVRSVHTGCTKSEETPRNSNNAPYKDESQ